MHIHISKYWPRFEGNPINTSFEISHSQDHFWQIYIDMTCDLMKQNLIWLQATSSATWAKFLRESTATLFEKSVQKKKKKKTNLCSFYVCKENMHVALRESREEVNVACKELINLFRKLTLFYQYKTHYLCIIVYGKSLFIQQKVLCSHDIRTLHDHIVKKYIFSEV